VNRYEFLAFTGIVFVLLLFLRWIGGDDWSGGERTIYATACAWVAISESRRQRRPPGAS
jgi:Na+/melibiose symporter-like transporter